MWIGYQALIMPGVKIGNGAIISSRSVVTSDVPAYAIVGGNPARIIKKRFSDDTIATLEKLAWWDWPIEQITQNLTTIMSGDIDALRD
ncbi:Chloramphenicol acetyltransferase [compost metagenome]